MTCTSCPALPVSAPVLAPAVRWVGLRRLCAAGGVLLSAGVALSAAAPGVGFLHFSLALIAGALGRRA